MLRLHFPPQDIGEEVVAFVDDDDDGGKIDDFDLAGGFHAEFGGASSHYPNHPALC